MSQFHAVADARGTGSGFGGTTPMDHSDVVKTKGATSAAASFVSPLPSLVQGTQPRQAVPCSNLIFCHISRLRICTQM